jgi:hypothetical protein
MEEMMAAHERGGERDVTDSREGGLAGGAARKSIHEAPDSYEERLQTMYYREMAARQRLERRCGLVPVCVCVCARKSVAADDMRSGFHCAAAGDICRIGQNHVIYIHCI